MTYEYMMGSGMGTAHDDARAAYTRGQELFRAGSFQAAYEQFSRANSLEAHPTAVQSMASSAASAGNCRQALVHFRQYISTGEILNADARTLFYRCLDQEGQAPPAATPPPAATAPPATTPPPVTRPPVTTPPPAATTPPAPPGEPAPTGEKETWWTGDVTEMVGSFFSKLGIGEQASSEATAVARTEGAVATAAQQPVVQPSAPGAPVQPTTTTPPRPWYVQYAPHMVVGGLGVGAVITLVLVMRNR